MVVVEHGVQDDGSLSSNGIRSVFEDREGRLWVATITGGLNLLDRARWRFRHWRTGNGDRGRVPEARLDAVIEHGRTRPNTIRRAL